MKLQSSKKKKLIERINKNKAISCYFYVEEKNFWMIMIKKIISILKLFKTGLFFCYVLEFIPVDLNTRYTELNHPHYKQYTSSW